jgi:transcriptional regulator with XRE-family HTH domain
MRLNEILLLMREKRRRELVGDIVRDELARQRDTFSSQKAAAERMHMAPSTLSRVLGGEDERVSGITLRSIEGVLNFPDHLLTYVIEGDRASIEAIGDLELRPGLRRVILQRLDAIAAEGIEDVGGEAHNG